MHLVPDPTHAGQENVWDFPRPAIAEHTSSLILNVQLSVSRQE